MDYSAANTGLWNVFIYLGVMAGLLLLGYLFSAGVTELVLRGSRLGMGRLYRIPLHLMLALFYLAPWLCASLLEENRLTELQWRIFAFPVVAAVLLLTLVPATRRGPAYANDNGSPWRWPLYPWTAFGAITLAVALRTFALCMTFGPTGPIWVRLPASCMRRRWCSPSASRRSPTAACAPSNSTRP